MDDEFLVPFGIQLAGVNIPEQVFGKTVDYVFFDFHVG
jgi:hypothetical protein